MHHDHVSLFALAKSLTMTEETTTIKGGTTRLTLLHDGLSSSSPLSLGHHDTEEEKLAKEVDDAPKLSPALALLSCTTCCSSSGHNNRALLFDTIESKRMHAHSEL